MSTQYQSSIDVPTEVLAARLNELADVVAQKRDRIGAEFTMRIPAECDRDADLVMSEAARRLSAAPDTALAEAFDAGRRAAQAEAAELAAALDGMIEGADKASWDGYFPTDAITRAVEALADYRNQGGE